MALSKSSKPFNQYELAHAAFQIQGYWNYDYREVNSEEETFESAKEETLTNLRRAVAVAESMTLEQFKSYKKKDFEAEREHSQKVYNEAGGPV